jgi:PAS domain S-box-containing protein
MDSSAFTSTQKVRIEKDLKLSEDRFRIIVEQTGQLVYDYQVLTGKISWAGAVEPITGYKSREFQKFGVTEWEQMIHPEDRLRIVQQMHDSMVSCAQVETEYRFQRKNGNYIYVEDHGIFLRGDDGVVSRMLGVMSDVTARIEARDALQRSEELYRSLAEASSHMVWTADALGNAEMDHKTWSIFTGLSPEEVMGQGWAKAIHPEDLPLMMEVWNRSLTTGDAYRHEYRLRRSDGVYRMMLAKAVPTKKSNGEIRNWIGTCLDVTEQRESEKRQILLESQLRQSQKMEAIGTLAGGIAHDFNNILMAIISYGELAKFEASKQPDQLDNICHILEAAERARDLVKQILSFSRQTRQETCPVRLTDVSDQALKLLKAALSSQIEIRVDYEKNLPAILADSTQMQQVILNLCTNSAQALKRKGGLIELSLSFQDFSQPALAEQYELPPGAYVLLRVSDNGSGMDQDTAKRIFDPFFTTKGPGEGTGLGLSVVHGIVAAHHGVIKVSSQQGQGTTFDLYFPAVFAKDDLSPTIEPQMSRGTGQKILIVDDEIKICNSVSRILERLGYWTDSLIRPAQAWALLENNIQDWDLVITDLTMPGMTGIQLAEKIHQARADLPILLITGYSGTWTREQLTEKGITEMLTKPIMTQDLAEAVARALLLKKTDFN